MTPSWVFPRRNKAYVYTDLFPNVESPSTCNRPQLHGAGMSVNRLVDRSGFSCNAALPSNKNDTLIIPHNMNKFEINCAKSKKPS